MRYMYIGVGQYLNNMFVVSISKCERTSGYRARCLVYSCLNIRILASTPRKTFLDFNIAARSKIWRVMNYYDLECYFNVPILIEGGRWQRAARLFDR